MKKLYLFLVLSVCMAFAANALDYTFKITVEDPDNVKITHTDYYYNAIDEYEVKEGVNEYAISVNDSERLLITVSEGKILKVLNEDGSQNFDVTDNKFDLYLSPYNWGGMTETDQAYTVKTYDEATFRNHSVKVTLDKPDGIRMTLLGGSVINTDKTEYIIPFNDEYETQLDIRAANTDNLIYKITADGVEIQKKGNIYTIPLVDRSDADVIKYVENIVITQEFPEDMNYNIKIAFTNGDAACVSSVTYGDEPIEDFAAADGFTVRPGKKLMINLNKADYKILSYSLNGGDENQATYLSYISEIVGSDLSYVITAEKYEILEATFVVDDPNIVKITKYVYPYEELNLVAGENKVTFKISEDAEKFKISAREEGYEIARIYDATYEKEITVSTTYSSTNVTLAKNSRIEITSGKIVRDKTAVVYIDDIDGLNYGFSITRGGASISGKAGYNLVDFRDKDGRFTLNASGAEAIKAYRNGEEVSVSYPSYFSLENPKDNEVIKLFRHEENAVLHTVTFEMLEGALDGFEVKKDILAEVDATAPVSAVGKTTFTISPVSRDAEGLTVTIGDKTIEAVDGVYTFDTEADTTVKVSKATSGIEDVIYGKDGSDAVYNLQGVRVATEADINSLPAGIYVVNGKKVAVK